MPKIPDRLTRNCGILLAVAFAFSAGSCAGEPDTVDGPGLQIKVAPLSLGVVRRVCYDIAVVNYAGDLVWQAGDPNISASDGDMAAICSNDYGTGIGGDIQYNGSCDSEFNPNLVRIMVDGVYVFDATNPPAGERRLVDGTEWLPTCTAAEPCEQWVQCEPSGNTLVLFDLVVMRSAGQGFFDIAVRFDDIFCSAKVDCTYDKEGNDPIVAIHDGDTPVNTAVIGLACTAGPDTDQEDVETVLHVNDVRIHCGENGPGGSVQTGLWSCTPDGTETFGFGLTWSDNELDVQGVSVARTSLPLEFPASFDVQPFQPPNLESFSVPHSPGSFYDRAVMFRTFSDAWLGEGLVVMIDSTFDDSFDTPFAHMHIALASKSTDGWQITSAAPVPFPTWKQVMPRAYDATTGSLIAVTSFDDFGGDGDFLVRYQLNGAPGSRSFAGVENWPVPAGLSNCGNVHAQDGVIVTECRRARDDVEGFEAVLWVVDTVHERNDVLLADPGAEVLPYHRVSAIEYAGHMRTNDGSLVIASNARFQWSEPADAGNYDQDSDSFAVIWACPPDGNAPCKADDGAITHDHYRSHLHFTPLDRRKPTRVKAIVDQFVFGNLGVGYLEEGAPVQTVTAAIFEHTLDAGNPPVWHLAWVFEDMVAQTTLGDDITVTADNIDIEGIYPQTRVIWGRIGPSWSWPGGNGSFEAYRFWYLANIPDTNLAVVAPRMFPHILPMGYSGFVGSVGTESDRRLLMRWSFTQSNTPLSFLIELVFDEPMEIVKSFSYVLPIAGTPPDDFQGFGRWDTSQLQEHQARNGYHQSSQQDTLWPICRQIFGAVDGLSANGQVPAIIEPVVDSFPFEDPIDPVGVLGSIDVFELALGWPLSLPSWLSGYGAGTVMIDPAGPVGNHWHFGDPVMGIPPSVRPPGTAPIHRNHAIYRGVESLECGEVSCNKLYWNVAIGFDPNVPNCTLYFDATASARSSLVNGMLPPGSYWPWLQATVPLTGPDANTGQSNMTCRQHPMGSKHFPAAAIRAEDVHGQACYRYDGNQTDVFESCEEDGYWNRYREYQNVP